LVEERHPDCADGGHADRLAEQAAAAHGRIVDATYHRLDRRWFPPTERRVLGFERFDSGSELLQPRDDVFHGFSRVCRS